MILGSFLRAVGQLGDSRFRRVFLLGVGLTFALLVAFYAGFLWFLTTVFGDDVTVPLVGEVTWLNDLLTWGSFGLMMLFSIFLMVPVASAITSMFLEEVAQAVEDRHYTGLPPAQKIPLGDAARDTLNFLGVLVGANFLALFAYMILPPFSPFIFWGLNGFLLGREYFTLAAMRRVGRVAAKRLRRRHFGTIWIAGVLMAMPLSVPMLNLLVPILGAATFTHLFHQIQRRD